MVVSPDNECPAFSDEELAEFKRISNERRLERQRQTVTIRVPARTLEKAREYGKGYTSIMSQIIEKVLDNPELMRQIL